MFEKSLTDLIRGIRANKKNEEAYINQALDEIRGEVRRNDPDIKAVAVAKLFYLHMHGYDMSWASFHVVEVMSSSKFTHKRIGYIAAAISFKQDTDVLMLCTNLIKKDLSSNNFLETALALNGLCTIVTPDLGRDLAPDLIAMLNHSRPYIRKRVLLCLYKVFLKYPEALRVAFPRLKDKLDDSDPSVVSSAVNVICELARKNPKSYLNLAPQLYNLLTNSSNNWMLIKIVKLFGALTPLEPRLIKKLVPPITSLIQSTTAMSLLYECIHTVITGQMISPETPGSDSEDNQDTALARLCVSKLQLFVEDADQNLKYLGLFALCKLLPLRPRAVTEHRDTILECLDDKDISIRMRALELISGMVTKKNVIDIVKKLMLQVTPLSESKDSRANASASLFAASENNYSLEVVSRILQFCSRNTYELITDFEWYVAALARLVHVPRISVGTEISSQLIDVAVRVKEVRPFAVAQMVNLLSDTSIIESSSLEVNNVEALFAAGWICGEFNESLADPLELLDILTAPNISKLPGRIQAVYLHASFKIYSSWVHRSVHMAEDPFKENTAMLQGRYHKFSTSEDLEVQERASISYQLLNLVDVKTSVEEWTVPKLALELSSLFDGELNPVGPRAQKKVPLPEGLDLDKYIYEPEVEPANEVDVPDDSDADDGLFRELTSSRNGDRIVEEDDRRRTEVWPSRVVFV
ncbi:Clathrin/coatomer adaptor, adaptin-like protein [Zopfochytrium polystomum]|nr:Clathrin/coatomer adaptor, adaptin-like protein [Zopfochytrium polystomum]